MDFIFLACIDLDQAHSGIARKVRSEYKALCRNFDGCLVGCTKNGVKVINGTSEQNFTVETHLLRAVLKEVIKLSQENVKYVYIRRIPCNPLIISTLAKLKKQGVEKIVWEVPTYPYDHEQYNAKKISHRLINRADPIFRKQLKKYVDRIITYSTFKQIFGIQTIITGNGIDVAEIRPRNVNIETDDLNLIAVAVLSNWHGYDRLLQGIYEYYKNGGTRSVVFHLVGDGFYLPQYKEIAANLQIEDHVIFYGFKNIEDIDEIYDKCNIAVDSLGWHRSQVELGTSLKSREYLAKGLPIIASTPMDIFPDGWEYAYYAPVDESPIDIDGVISFYDQIHKKIDDKELAKKIRNIAYDKCDMSRMMQPVVDFYNQ